MIGGGFSWWFLIPSLMAPVMSAVSAVIAYRTAKRNASGSAQTSDAATVFNQAQTLIDKYMREVDRLTKHVDDLEGANQKLREEKAVLDHRVGQLERQIAEIQGQCPLCPLRRGAPAEEEKGAAS